MSSRPQQVTVQAPSRIHLGLLSTGEFQGRRYGGVGVMLEQPRLVLRAKPAECDHYAGLLTGRVQKFTRRWRESSGITDGIHIEITEAPPEHVGLGLGTQLGLAVATALDGLFQRPSISLERLVASVDRGLRSAVGAHGFEHGGLIADGGKASGDTLGSLECHISLPTEWHVLLVRIGDDRGLAGQEEIQAFQRLNQASNDPSTEIASNALHTTLYEQLLPAAKAEDFNEFSTSVYEYGRMAGEMFALSQGGPYASQHIANFVEYGRAAGVAGIGQSSWGPTVFCWFSSESDALSFKKQVNQDFANHRVETTVSPVSRQGAHVTIT